MGLDNSALAKVRALRFSSSAAACLAGSALQAGAREQSAQIMTIHKYFITFTSLVLLSVSGALVAL
ncbi:hypothetical protein D3C85_1668270 [compost metagenome]